MGDFTYHAPATLAEAVALLARHGVSARALAGGTDLALALAQGLLGAEHVVDLKRVRGLDSIAGEAATGWHLGALACMAEVAAHLELKRFLPAVTAGASYVGGPPIRNRATLGGNLCNASPAADTATPLLALDATVALTGPEGDRALPLADLWQGPRRSALQPGEVMTAVMVPALQDGSGNAFTRLTRSAMDIAVVNAAAVVVAGTDGTVGALRVALGAVGPTPLLVPGLDALAGRPADEALLDAVRQAAEEAAQPIDDVRASAAYRREMAGVLAARAVRDALAHARGTP